MLFVLFALIIMANHRQSAYVQTGIAFYCTVPTAVCPIPRLGLYWSTNHNLAAPCGCSLFGGCRYICLDEGDRMLDMGFDEEVRHAVTLRFDTRLPAAFIYAPRCGAVCIVVWRRFAQQPHPPLSLIFGRKLKQQPQKIQTQISSDCASSSVVQTKLSILSRLLCCVILFVYCCTAFRLFPEKSKQQQKPKKIAGAKDHEPFQAAAADASLLGYHAAEVPGLRQGRPCEAGTF